MPSVLLDLIAAHPAVDPATLDALASGSPAHPTLIRALLTNPHLSVTGTDHTLRAITTHLHTPDPPCHLASGATLGGALAHLRGLTVEQWEWLFATLPTFPPELARAASSSAVRSQRAGQSILAALAGAPTLPMEVRTNALVALGRTGALPASALRTVILAAAAHPNLTANLVTPGLDPTQATLFGAAKWPYPPEETATTITHRFLAGDHRGDAALRALCALLRSGERATGVAQQLLTHDPNRAAWLLATAHAVNVDDNLRTKAATRALARGHDGAQRPLQQLITTGTLTAAALTCALTLPGDPAKDWDLRGALTREDLTGEHIALLIRAQTQGRLHATPGDLADLAARPAATSDQREHLAHAATTAPRTHPDDLVIATLARECADDPSAWTRLPMRLVAPEHLGLGARAALTVALTPLLADVTADWAPALLTLPLDTLPGTVADALALVRAVAT